MRNKLLTITILSAMLAGCGGGGGGASANTASFTLTAKIDGVAVSGLSVKPGQTDAIININSGQELEIDSTEAVNFTVTMNGATSTVKSITSTVWDAILNNPAAANVVFTVTSQADASQAATITVKPQQYSAFTRKVGDNYTMLGSGSFNNGTTPTWSPSLNTTTAVNGNNSYSARTTNVNTAALVSTASLDANGNALSVTRASDGQACNYTPSRTVLSFPLYVGKTYTTTWANNCTVVSLHEDVSQAATIQAYETVSVPAGTFKALKMHLVQTYTNSTDTNLTGGGTGNGAYVIDETCWYVPNIGRIVKCTYHTTYTGTPPPLYFTDSDVVMTAYQQN
jgi:hypothetical protein